MPEEETMGMPEEEPMGMPQEEPMEMPREEPQIPQQSFVDNEFKTINTGVRQQQNIQQEDDGVLFPDAPESHRKKPQLY